jgi:hypothetical protein
MTYAVEETDPLARYRPSGQMLMVMLRAAAVDDGKGGPWLTMARSHATPRVFVHHVSVSEPHPFTNNILVMCSGVELLGKFCTLTRGVPANIIRPHVDELRALGNWAIERVDTALWDQDIYAWGQHYNSARAQDRRTNERDDCVSRVRSLRWLMAEEWLR